VRAPSNGSQTNLPKHSLGIQVRQQAGLHGLRKDGLHFLGRVEERWVALPWKCKSTLQNALPPDLLSHLPKIQMREPWSCWHIDLEIS
jgi:hypothetical protein